MEMEENPMVARRRAAAAAAAAAAPPAAVVGVDYEYGPAGGARAGPHVYVEPNSSDKAKQPAAGGWVNTAAYEMPALIKGVAAMQNNAQQPAAPSPVVVGANVLQPTTDNTSVYAEYTSSAAAEHDAYDMPTAAAPQDESNLLANTFEATMRLPLRCTC
jgi:hypothetical protein